MNLRCRIFKSPYGDQGILIHKDQYFKTHGFKDIPIMEDVDFISRLDKRKNLLNLKEPIYTSSRKWDRNNFINQSFINWRLRRRWLRGDGLKSIYTDYYNSKN